jgi:hypothetical protein
MSLRPDELGERLRHSLSGLEELERVLEECRELAL